jgi:hypothetical protein
MGSMYGEPYCPCEMKNRGLQAEMDNNPLRKAEEVRAEASWKEFMDSGGFRWLIEKK